MGRAVMVICVVLALGAPALGDPKPGVKPLTPGEALVVGDAAAALGALIEWHVDGCNCDTSGGFPLFIMGGMFYASFGPITHAKAGHAGRAAMSGLARVGLPVGGLVLAHRRDWDTGATIGATLGGMRGAIALDWFVISRAGSDDDHPAFSVYVTPAAGGAIAGVGGSL